MTNEAAERLHGLIERWAPPAVTNSLRTTLAHALADERKDTVERVWAACQNVTQVRAGDLVYLAGIVENILDAEAAR